MDALVPDGILAAVVMSSVFAADDTKARRKEFLAHHTLLGMVSLPEDLFYPTAAPTAIMIALAHTPQAAGSEVFMAKVMDDGFEKLKRKLVRKIPDASQLDEVRNEFHAFRNKTKFKSQLCNLPARTTSCTAESGALKIGFLRLWRLVNPG